MDVQWRDLAVCVGNRQILAPFSGELLKGRMVAVMGPSGSGKSTLLSCLRQVVPHQGEVRYDGARFCAGLRQCIGFTEQDDVVLPQLTVRQSLRFLADLRFGIGAPESLKRVEEVMSALRLRHIADSIIGDSAGGGGARISGGERRRSCIARELLAEPRLLLCDEPTSGLDSTMAAQVVASMRELCDAGRVSVIASIHQPSTTIFETFDHLLLLREGQVLYDGPSAEAVQAFTQKDIKRRPAESSAEFLMDLLVIGEQDGACRLPPELRGEFLDMVRKQGATLPALPSVRPASVERKYTALWTRQVAILSRRHGLLLRGEVFSKTGAVENVGLMLIAALLWIQLGFREEDVFPRWGLCCWICGTWMFLPLMGALGTFADCRRVLEKELSVGCYSLSAYYVARTIVLLPAELVWPTLWTTGVYWISNVNPDGDVFVKAMLLVHLNYGVFQSLGLAVGALSLPPAHANTLTMLMVTFFFAWTGFFVDLATVPACLRWLQHINPFKYSIELMMTVVVPDDAVFSCNDGRSSGAEVMQAGCTLTLDGWRVSGREARARYGVEVEPLYALGALVASLVVFRTLAFALLRNDLRAAIHGVQGGAHEGRRYFGKSAGGGEGIAVVGKEVTCV